MFKRVFVVTLAAVLLTACGNAKNEAVVSAGASVEEASILESTGAENGTDYAIEEQEGDDCTWKSGYRKSVEDLYKNGYDDSFSLYDLNNDGIPEMFLSVDRDSYSYKREIYVYDEASEKLNPTGVYCACADDSGVYIPVRQIKDTKCFITGPDASGQVVFYTIENSNLKRLLGCKVPGEVHDCSDGNGNTISKEEFVSEFNEFMGIDWEKVASGIEKNIDLHGYLTGDLSQFIGYEHDRIDYAFDGEDIGKVRYNDSYAVYSDYISPKERLWVTLDEESEKLYDAFIQGKEKAVFSVEGNRIMDSNPFSRFEDGQAYTLEEISNKIRGVDDFTGCSPQYIDCGLDGNIELVVGIGGNLDYDPSYGIDMVVKNINGKLKICYCDASGYRSENDISYNGEVYNGGSGGATSHYGEVGYIDANGKYNFWYSWNEEEIAKIDTNNEQLDLYQEDLSVEDGAEDKDHYYSIFTFDNDGNVDEGDSSLKDDPCECERQTYRDKGYKVITLKEHDELIEKKRKKIGLSDEIHSYGDEYKDED